MKRKQIESTSIQDLEDILPLTSKIPLKELDNLIGMESVKESIIDMIQLLLVQKLYPSSEKMLHMSISGPPGVGKTTVATILGKILFSLGLIESVKGPSISFKTVPEMLNENLPDVMEISLNSSKICKILDEIEESFDEEGGFLDFEDYKSLKSRTERIMKSSLNLTYPELVKKIDQPISKITVGVRENFVGEYVGHTAPKTQKFLDSCLGGILILDEAYSLINGEGDSFGAEALTILNEYMSLYPSKLIVIFCGYQELMDKTIFSVQPGLKRRIAWSFNIPNYSPSSLSKIFAFQAKKEGWTIDCPSLDKLLFENAKIFTAFGGDTSKLLLFSRICHAKDHLLQGKKKVKMVLREKHIQEGLKKLIKSKNIKEKISLDHLYL